MALPPIPNPIPRKRKATAAAGAFMFKKSQGANSAAMRYREDSNGNSGFGATSPRATKPKSGTRKKRQEMGSYSGPSKTSPFPFRGPKLDGKGRKPFRRPNGMGIINRRIMARGGK